MDWTLGASVDWTLGASGGTVLSGRFGRRETVARKIGLTFSAGVAGGLVAALAEWLIGGLLLPETLGLRLTPPLSSEWLHPRLIGGGLWALLFLTPTPPRWSLAWRGLVFSLAPGAITLLNLFFSQPEPGAGLVPSLAAVPMAVARHAVWGLTAGWCLEVCGYLELMRDRLRVKAVKI